MTDPFIEVKDDVDSSLKQAKSLLERIKQSRSSAVSSSQRAQEVEDLEAILGDIDNDLLDLSQSVDIISRDAEKFKITGLELESRKGFVKGVRKEVDEMRLAIENTSTPVSKYDEVDGVEDGLSEADRDFEEQYQRQLMQEQDIQLEGVYSTVGNIRWQAQIMGQEMGEQAELLEDLEMQVDSTAGKLKKGMKRIEVFIKKNEGENVHFVHTLMNQIPRAVAA